jgi:hypothetical protein
MSAHKNVLSLSSPSVEKVDTADKEVDEKNSTKGRLDRKNRVLLPFWTSVSARKQLKYLAIEEDRTQQNLLEEALNLLFQSRGRPPIA